MSRSAKTVAIDIAGATDRVTRIIAAIHAAELEAIAAIQLPERHARAKAARLAIDHIGRPGPVTARGTRRADEQVREAIAIEIPGTAHGRAGSVVIRHAFQLESVVAIQRRQRLARPKSIGPAEDDIGHTSKRTSFTDIRPESTDDHIVKPIAIDIPGTADRCARLIEAVHASADAGEFAPIGAIERRQHQPRRKGLSLSEDHIGGSREDGSSSRDRGVGQRPGCAGDQIVKTVPIHIAGRADRATAQIVIVISQDFEAVLASSVERAKLAPKPPALPKTTSTAPFGPIPKPWGEPMTTSSKPSP